MKLSKINQELLSVSKELVKFHGFSLSDEFDSRDGYIVANIKCYDYLDDDDVRKICKDFGYSEDIIEQVICEFDDERLYNTWNHAAENFIHDLREDLSNHYAIKDSPYSGDLKDFGDALIRLRLDHRHMYCFGRSGGWFSIMKDETFDYNYEYGDCYADDVMSLNDTVDNHAFNLMLNDIDIDSSNKRKVINEIKDRISQIEQYIEDIRIVLETISKWAKNGKENALYQLECDIELWVYDTIQGNERIDTIKAEEDDIIVTSQGIKVHADECVYMYNTLSKLIKENEDKEFIKCQNMKVGNFNVTSLAKKDGKWIVKIGCHKIALEQANEILKNLNELAL